MLKIVNEHFDDIVRAINSRYLLTQCGAVFVLHYLSCLVGVRSPSIPQSPVRVSFLVVNLLWKFCVYNVNL